jgi:hypothetical protein
MSTSIAQKSTPDNKFYVIPALTSNTSYPTPTIHQVKLHKPIVAGDTSISIALDNTFEPISGAYTASSKYPLYLNTLLYFKDGDDYKLIEIVDDNYAYNLTTTVSIVPIKRSRQAIPINAIAQSYLAAPASGIQAHRNGSILTIRDPSRRGRINQDIQTMGNNLAYIFFAKDYEQKKSHEVGVVQLAPSSNDTSRAIQCNLQRLLPESNDKIQRMLWGMSTNIEEVG